MQLAFSSDIAERVGAAIAISIRIRHLADADAIEDNPNHTAKRHSFIIASYGLSLRTDDKDSVLVIVRMGLAKVTSKYQVTVPRTIAKEYNIHPGDEIDWVACYPRHPSRHEIGGEKPAIAVTSVRSSDHAATQTWLRICGQAAPGPWLEARGLIYVAALVDTNVLVYRFDNRFPAKQRIAIEVVRRGIVEDSVRVPHQAIVEFVAAVTRSIRGHVILEQRTRSVKPRNS